MMKQIAIILLSILILQGCKSGSDVVRGNGKMVSYEIPVKNYSEIMITGACDLIYEQKVNKSPYLKVEIDENLKDMLNVKNRNGKLSISLKRNTIAAVRYKVYTNSNQLDGLKITGAGKVTLKNEINSPDLKVAISGIGILKADKLKCANFVLSLSGSGNVNLSGEVYNSKVKVSGSGNVDAFGLKTQNTVCEISGSGNAKVYASEFLHSRISGSGNIVFKGNPKRKDTKVSGSGTIKSK